MHQNPFPFVSISTCKSCLCQMATLEGAFGKNWGAEEEAVWLRVFGLIMHAAKVSKH